IPARWVRRQPFRGEERRLRVDRNDDVADDGHLQYQTSLPHQLLPGLNELHSFLPRHAAVRPERVAGRIAAEMPHAHPAYAADLPGAWPDRPVRAAVAALRRLRHHHPVDGDVAAVLVGPRRANVVVDALR